MFAGKFLPSPPELIHECLVDGYRAHHGRDLPLDELIAAGRRVSEALGAKVWSAWSALVRDAIDRSEPTERAEALGQALEAVRLWGPVHEPPELETIVTSLARYWPTST
jgi:hypothetical protein